MMDLQFSRAGAVRTFRRPGAVLAALILACVLLAPLAAAHPHGHDHADASQEAHVAAPAFPGAFGVQVVMRWVHVITAVVVVGGVIFMRLMLAPVAGASLDPAAQDQLRAGIMARWRKVVHVGILLFLISGFYNYFFVTRFAHEAPAYHMLFGIKFLLALVVFALALMLSSSKGYAARIQANATAWTGVLIVLALITIMLGGYMKALH